MTQETSALPREARPRCPTQCSPTTRNAQASVRQTGHAARVRPESRGQCSTAIYGVGRKEARYALADDPA